jgi:type 1 glutamine amidotransferase
MRGVPASFKITDELYEVTTRTGGVPVTVLAETQPSPNSKQTHPSVWVPTRENGRTVGLALGHDGRARGAPEFNRLLINAVEWTAGR